MQFGEVDGVGKRVSRLVLGTIVLDPASPEETFGLLDAAFELGYNAFDTAHVYGAERERAFGRWVAERKVRDRVVILGKGAHPGKGGGRLAPEHVRSDLQESLERMGTDYVDIYLLHRDDPSVPVGPVVEALNELHEAGLIGAFGGSNWTWERIREANQYSDAHGLRPFSASSPNFSLAEQIGEAWGGCIGIGGPSKAGARAWYRRTGMPVFAWSSLARGFLSGRLTSENYDEIKETLDGACVRGFCYEPNFRRLDRAHELAAEKGVSVPRIALAFILNQGLNVFPLVGCRNRRELADDLGAFGLELTPEEAAWLDLQSEER
jgi:aryl-alcohol dehydrogenase-like predicted oxidoreductase